MGKRNSSNWLKIIEPVTTVENLIIDFVDQTTVAPLDELREIGSFVVDDEEIVYDVAKSDDAQKVQKVDAVKKVQEIVEPPLLAVREVQKPEAEKKVQEIVEPPLPEQEVDEMSTVHSKGSEYEEYDHDDDWIETTILVPSTTQIVPTTTPIVTSREMKNFRKRNNVIVFPVPVGREYFNRSRLSGDNMVDTLDSLAIGIGILTALFGGVLVLIVQYLAYKMRLHRNSKRTYNVSYNATELIDIDAIPPVEEAQEPEDLEPPPPPVIKNTVLKHSADLRHVHFETT